MILSVGPNVCKLFSPKHHDSCDSHAILFLSEEETKGQGTKVCPFVLSESSWLHLDGSQLQGVVC